MPPGCAHGFLVLSDWADICYKHDATYAPGLEMGVIWDDPDLAIAWPLRPTTISERDRVLPRLAEIRDRLGEWFGTEPPPARPDLV